MLIWGWRSWVEGKRGAFAEFRKGRPSAAKAVLILLDLCTG